jgi:deoxyribodipyrimidine photo-lyase
MRLFWHRRDLRATDNAGLAAAAENGPVVPVFVFDDAVLDHAAPPRVAFMLDALESLRDWYRNRGSDLLVARGDPAAVLSELAADHGADRVVWNRDYSGLADERDARVADALADDGLDRETHHDAVHHEPGAITTNEGEPYAVFSYYGRKWADRPKADPYEVPEEEALASVSGDSLPTLGNLGFDTPEATLPPAGTAAARKRLAAFCEGPIYRYDESRDYPAREATSGLSPHLKFGTLGVREVYDATRDAMADADSEGAVAGVEEFREQLAWREFYAQVLADRPDVVTRNYRTYEHPIEWRDDPAEIRAWQAGETGYPFVDAGMRQLREEAVVHNRVRMVVASFLTKDLLADWRHGYRWFREKLVDHDTANDTGGWQWAASTGTDAQPYFRVFNPTTQGERYDPEAEYIREHVPELRGVDPETIHDWPTLDDAERAAVAPEYPVPIVDHAQRRECAIEMFEAARDAE